jgi:D-3-phosphoglycerate dehydrogenase
LVNDQDLLQAISDKKVAAYVTDFPNEVLLGKENVICIPHLGASTPESEENCAVMAVEQLIDFLENGNIINSVNFPKAYLPRSSGKRLTITNKNIPKMVLQITNVLAEGEINIAEMLNKHRDNIAYNIIDVDSPIDASLIEKIKQIDGVLSVRYIE